MSLVSFYSLISLAAGLWAGYTIGQKIGYDEGYMAGRTAGYPLQLAQHVLDEHRRRGDL